MTLTFLIQGLVIHGNKRGKLLGFPTANLKIAQQIPEGIYTAQVFVDGKMYKSATFIGTAKTFKETVYQAESFIMDFDEDIYGKEIRIKLYKKSPIFGVKFLIDLISNYSKQNPMIKCLNYLDQLG